MITAGDQMRAEREEKLAFWRAQAALTDAQFLQVYCDAKRREAAGAIKMLEEAKAVDEATTAYVRKYGTDVG